MISYLHQRQHLRPYCEESVRLCTTDDSQVWHACMAGRVNCNPIQVSTTTRYLCRRLLGFQQCDLPGRPSRERPNTSQVLVPFCFQPAARLSRSNKVVTTVFHIIPTGLERKWETVLAVALMFFGTTKQKYHVPPDHHIYAHLRTKLFK